MQPLTLTARRRAVLIGALALGLLASPVAQVHAQSADEDMPDYQGVDQLDDIKLTFAQFSSQAQAPYVQALANYVAEASKGKIQIEVFWSGSLMTVGETPQGVGSGLADMGNALPVYTPADFPVTNWVTSLANRFPVGQVYGKLVAAGTSSEFYIVNDDIRREYDKQGLHILGASGGAAYDLLCNKPVSNLEEAKGKRARSPTQAFANEVGSLGMTPVPVAITEVYEAYSRGILDCVILYPWGYDSFGLTGVGDKNYWLRIPMSGWMAQLTLVNKDRWATLPPLAQRILVDAFSRYLEVDVEGQLKGAVAFGNSIQSGKVVPLDISDDMRLMLKAHQDKVIADMVKNAPEGVTDPQQAIDQFTGLLDKWGKIVSNDLAIAPEPDDAKDAVASWYKDYDFKQFQRRAAEELAAAYAQTK